MNLIKLLFGITLPTQEDIDALIAQTAKEADASIDRDIFLRLFARTDSTAS